MKLHHLPSRIIQIQEKEYRYFSGTSYLGMGHNLAFREKLWEGMNVYGTAYGSSRSNLLQLSIYEEAERFLANWTKAPAALTCSSGLLAGQIVSRFLEKEENKSYFFAPKTHPANWNNSVIRKKADSTPLDGTPLDGTPLDGTPLASGNFQEWEHKIVERVEEAENEDVVIVTNSIDSFACEAQKFDFIQQLPKNRNITIVIDDSHGIGVTGENGAGVFSQINCPANVKLIVVASMNKALGIPGGMILSDKQTIEAIQQSPFWIGASPIVPAYLFAFIHAQEAYTQSREKLQQNSQFFTEKIKDSNLFDYLPNYPVFKSKETNLYDKLIEKQIMPYHFIYPSQSTEAVTRLVISSLHTEEDLEILANYSK